MANFLLSFLIFALFHANAEEEQQYKFTIIHTNDVHGWINAHPRNPSVDATFGDLYNFVSHKKANVGDNEFVLLFDSGDMSQGTGLSDATKIQGEFIYEIAKHLPYDALCPGNHELISMSCVNNLAHNFVPHWNGGYVAANVKSLIPGHKLADKYTIIELPNNKGAVIVFGFMFSMKLHAINAIVNSVSSTLATDFVEEAFARAGPDRVKLCVCLCHIGTAQAEAEQVRQNLQKRIGGVPLVMLMGHSHQIAFKEDAENNVAFLESGSYMNIVGVLTATVTETPKDSTEEEVMTEHEESPKANEMAAESSSPEQYDAEEDDFANNVYSNVKYNPYNPPSTNPWYNSSVNPFYKDHPLPSDPLAEELLTAAEAEEVVTSKKYPDVVVSSKFTATFTHEDIPASRQQLMANAGVESEEEWATEEGKTIDSLIAAEVESLHLTDTLGCSDRLYKASRLPRNQTDQPGQPGSLYTLMVDQILPHTYGPTTSSHINFFVQGGSLIRGDIPEGPINTDDIYTSVPFTFPIARISGVTGKHMLKLLNSTQPPLPIDTQSLHDGENEEVAASKDPDFTKYYECSNYTIDTSKKYTIIGNEYDIMRILPRLFLIAPLRYWPWILKDTTPSVMIKYFKEAAKCPATVSLSAPVQKTVESSVPPSSPSSPSSSFPLFLTLSLVISSVLLLVVSVFFVVRRLRSHKTTASAEESPFLPSTDASIPQYM